MNLRRNAISGTNAALLFMVFLITVSALAYVFVYSRPAPGSPANPTVTNTANPSGFTNYNIGFTYGELNSISGGSVTTTSPTYSVYHSAGARLSTVSTLFAQQAVSIASGSTATKFPVLQADGAYLFVRVDTGTTEVPDPANFLKSNPVFTSCKWLSTTTATTTQLVCELSIAALGNPNLAIDPSASTRLLVPTITIDNDAKIDVSAATTGIGTTSGQDTYVTHTISLVTSNDGIIVAQVYYTTNQTATYLTNVPDITFSAGGYIVNMLTFTNLGTTLVLNPASVSTDTSGDPVYWRFWPTAQVTPNDYSGTIMFARASSNSDTIKLVSHIKTSFVANKVITFNINIRLISAGNALQGTSGVNNSDTGWMLAADTLAA